MNAESPMEPIHEGKRIKLYRAGKYHVYPGVHLWLGPKLGHLRLWPPKLINSRTKSKQLW